MNRKRFGKVPIGTAFLWDASQKSLHLKIGEDKAVILDTKSSYPIGTIVIMSEYCRIETKKLENIFDAVRIVYNRFEATNINTPIKDMKDTIDLLKSFI